MRVIHSSDGKIILNRDCNNCIYKQNDFGLLTPECNHDCLEGMNIYRNLKNIQR